MVYSSWCGCGAYLYRVGVRLEHLQSTHSIAISQRAVVVQSAIYDLHDSARSARTKRGLRWSLGRKTWSPCRSDGCVFILWNRSDHRWHWTGDQTILFGVSGHGNHRRNWLRTWLYFAGQHAREVVSRPPRYGDGHGDYGLWWGGVPGGLPERFFYGSIRCGHHDDRTRRNLLHRDDDRRAHPAPAAGRVETCRLDSSNEHTPDDHRPKCQSEPSHPDCAILFVVGHSVYQCHRGNRDSCASLPNDAGPIPENTVRSRRDRFSN